MTLVEIPELGSGREVDLGPAERRAVRLLGDKLRVEWLTPDRARLAPAGYVGSIRLSPALTVAVTTKVPVANILALASVAYRTLPLPMAVGETQLREAEPLDWLAFLIIAEVETLLARGMRQGYVEVGDDLPYVRGRIKFTAAARPWTRPGRLTCEFTDFLPDTPENQVLRATLEALGRSRLLPGLRKRALTATGWLHGVTLRAVTPALIAEVHWTRLNAHYRPAVELCRLYLEGRAVEQPTGEVSTPAFLFPMERVFEAAVANYLAGRMAGVTIQPQRSLAPAHGEPAHSLAFRPDLVIVDGTAGVVLDTKYADPERKTHFGTRSFRNDDLYQIAFYANEYHYLGLLVYPRAERDVDVTLQTAGALCAIVTVDLGLPGLAGLEALAGAVDAFLVEQSKAQTPVIGAPAHS